MLSRMDRRKKNNHKQPGRFVGLRTGGTVDRPLGCSEVNHVEAKLFDSVEIQIREDSHDAFCKQLRVHMPS